MEGAKIQNGLSISSFWKVIIMFHIFAFFWKKKKNLETKMLTARVKGIWSNETTRVWRSEVAWQVSVLHSWWLKTLLLAVHCSQWTGSWSSDYKEVIYKLYSLKLFRKQCRTKIVQWLMMGGGGNLWLPRLIWRSVASAQKVKLKFPQVGSYNVFIKRLLEFGSRGCFY